MSTFSIVLYLEWQFTLLYVLLLDLPFKINYDQELIQVIGHDFSRKH